MKAAVYHGARDLRLEEIAAPSGPLEPLEVLLDIAACGICGTDLHEYADGPILTSHEPNPLNGATLPQVLGHELSGTVADVGAAVSRIAPGDRVTVVPTIFCGTCHYCLRGMHTHCQRMASIGMSSPWGGFSSQAVVSEEQLTALPENVSVDEGALTEPAAVAINSVARTGVRPGSDVLVTGAGPIGALVALAAASAGAARLYVSEPNASRRAAIEALGVTETFDPGAGDVVGELLERTGGIGVDVAIECSGNGRALAACVAATRARGVIGQTGLGMHSPTVDVERITMNALTLVGCWCWPARDFGKVVSLVSAGRFPVEKVVSRRIALDDIVEDGFENLLAPTTGDMKVLVDVG